MLTYRGNSNVIIRNANVDQSLNDENSQNSKNKKKSFNSRIGKCINKQSWQNRKFVMVLSYLTVSCLYMHKLFSLNVHLIEISNNDPVHNMMSIKSKKSKTSYSPHKRIVFLSSSTTAAGNYLFHRRHVEEMQDEYDDEQVQDNDENIIPVNTSSCVPMRAWQESPKPSCNIVHEIDMELEIESRLGSGGWRVVWKITEDVVLKTVKLKSSSFGQVAMSRHFIDAIISDRLTSSSSVIDIYGHCAQTVLNELAISNLRSLIKKHNREDSRSPQLIAQYAFDISHALAEIHVIDDGDGLQQQRDNNNATIVYKDLKPDNIVLSKEGRLKLSDFNDSELLKWNITSNKQCYFRRKRWKANFHSPEEVWEQPLTHKLDIYALGSVLYYILVGYNPYNKIPDNEVLKSVANGKTPEIPLNIKNDNDPIIVGIMNIIAKCYEYNSEDRPNARSVEREISSLLLKKSQAN